MISIIACVDNKGGIGKNNSMPWHLPRDLQRFKETTEGHTVVMGRKTFESIGKLLSNRENIIMTRDPEPVFVPEGASPYDSVESVLKLANDKEVFIIGGAEIYKLFLPHADKMYMTVVLEDFKCDTFFPDDLHGDWYIMDESVYVDNGYSTHYMELER